jgi:hypothetical protein
MNVSIHNSHEQLSVSGNGFTPGDSADDLCDELMDHIFGCDLCINSSEEHCDVFCSLQERIAAAGGPIKSAILAI